jgi:small-conductance mechanosensitive channel
MSPTARAGEFTEAELDFALKQALRLLLALAAVGIVVAWIMAGWQSAALFAVGALASAFGVWEWRTLARVISVQFLPDEERGERPRPPSTGSVLVRFFLRLLLVGAALYVSLKCLHGSPYALIAGLGLAIVAITFQALRLLARWR